ncbi:MAG: DUF1127 domain-containing protein [Paracoccaceae bacterium]
MATLVLHRPTTFGTGIGTRLTAVFDAMSKWNDTRAARKSLGRLSDQMLDDIGLTRGDIDLITR